MKSIEQITNIFKVTPLLLDLEEIAKLPNNGPIINIFRYNNISYKLDRAKATKMYERICQLDDISKNKSINKMQPTDTLYSKITDALSNSIKHFNVNKYSTADPLILALLKRVITEHLVDICEAITRHISNNMLHELWSSFEKDSKLLFNCTYTEIVLNIGNACLAVYFHQQHQMFRARLKTQHNRMKLKLNKSEFNKRFYIFAAEEISGKLTYLLETKHKNKLKSSDNVFEYRASRRQDVDEWLVIAHFHFLMNTAPDKEMFAKIALKKQIKLDILDFRKDYYKLSAKFGSFIVDSLIHARILTSYKQDRITYVSIKGHHVLDVINATSYYKPPLHPKMNCIIHNKLVHKKYDITLITQINPIKEADDVDSTDLGDQKFTYNLSDVFERAIKTNNVKFTVKSIYYKLFLDYMYHIKTLSFDKIIDDPTSQDSIDIINFIYVTYNINFEAIRNNLTKPTDKTFLRKLLQYMNNFDQLYNEPYLDNLKQRSRTLYKKYSELKEKNYDHSGDNACVKFLAYQENSEISKILTERNDIRMKMKFFYKIIAQKYFVLNFMHDAFIYSHFNYFVIPRQITYITRIMSVPTFLTLQGNKFARPFLMTYIKHSYNRVNESSFINYKEIIKSKLSFIASKLDGLTYEQYVSETKRLHEEYLIQFFKDKIYNELLSIDFNSILEIMRVIGIKSFKKVNTAHTALGLLHYLKYPELYKYVDPFIYYDSTTSGTQIMALIFRNKTAAIHGCLFGMEKYDIYTEFLKDFNSFIKLINNISDKILLNAKYDKTRLKEDLSDVSFEGIKKLMDLFTKNINISSILDSFTENEKGMILNCFNFSWLKHYDVGLEFNVLAIVQFNFIIQTIIKDEPWLTTALNLRDLIKQRIMANLYGMTPRGGLNSIEKALNTIAIELGNISYRNGYIRILANIINRYFTDVFKPRHLDYMIEFQQIKKRAALLKHPLVYSNEYVTWKYSPAKEEKLRTSLKSYYDTNINDDDNIEDDISVDIDKVYRPLDENSKPRFKSKYKRRFLTIQIYTNELNRSKYVKVFCPYMVHTVEAWLTAKYLITGQAIHAELLHHLNIPYTVAPNYDCFATNMQNALLARQHLENCYIAIYNNNPIQNMIGVFNQSSIKDRLITRDIIEAQLQKPDSDKYWNGTITNPYFVKN